MSVAIITGLSVAVPSILTTIFSNRKNNVIIQMKIDALEEKVNKHNNLIDRTYQLEKKVEVLETINKIGGK